MKKKYIVPSVETVNVRLIDSVLEAGPGMGNDSYESGEIGAKENNAGVEEDEGLINPTQPNLWDDEED